jgi:DNA-binding transcriptional MerR regulator
VPPAGKAQLSIGEVAALTGIKPGRIRHYEAKGLVTPAYGQSGYRCFGAAEVLRLLYIDLLRSSGLGLEAIRRSVVAEPGDLRVALSRHAAVLRAERDRLDLILEVVEKAVEGTEADVSDATLIERLANVQRNSLGTFGRLARPLTPEADLILRHLLVEGWTMPVPHLFGQMLLPEPVTDLLERLARADGHEILFERLHALADRIVALGDGPEVLPQAERLGIEWVGRQIDDPPPRDVARVLQDAGPTLAELPVIREGFLLWAEALSPAAAAAFRAMAAEAGRRHLGIIGALVIPPPRSDSLARGESPTMTPVGRPALTHR